MSQREGSAAIETEDKMLLKEKRQPCGELSAGMMVPAAPDVVEYLPDTVRD